MQQIISLFVDNMTNYYGGLSSETAERDFIRYSYAYQECQIEQSLHIKYNGMLQVLILEEISRKVGNIGGTSHCSIFHLKIQMCSTSLKSASSYYIFASFLACLAIYRHVFLLQPYQLGRSVACEQAHSLPCGRQKCIQCVRSNILRSL